MSAVINGLFAISPFFGLIISGRVGSLVWLDAFCWLDGPSGAISCDAHDSELGSVGEGADIGDGEWRRTRFTEGEAKLSSDEELSSNGRLRTGELDI